MRFTIPEISRKKSKLRKQNKSVSDDLKMCIRDRLNGHLFRKTTLINLKFRSYNDNGTSGIVNSFTEKAVSYTHLKHFALDLISADCYAASQFPQS